MKLFSTHTRTSREGAPTGGWSERRAVARSPRSGIPSVIVLVLGIAAAAWLAARGLVDASAPRTVGAVLTGVILPLGAGISALLLRQCTFVEERVRTGWTFVGAGCIVAALGGIAGLLDLAGLNAETAGTWWGSAHHLAAVLLVVGTMHWVQRYSLGASGGLALDMAIVAWLGTVFAWNSALRDAMLYSGAPRGIGESLGAWQMVAWPVGGILLLVVVVGVLGQVGRRDVRTPIVMATFGVLGIACSQLFAASVAGESHNLTAVLDAGLGLGSLWAGDAGWVAGYMLIMVGALRMSRSGFEDLQDIPLIERSATWEIAWAAAPLVVLAVTVVSYESGATGTSRSGFLVLVGLLIVRCGLTLVQALRMSQRANTDPLTGAYNHRFFQEQVSSLAAQSRASGRPLSLLMIDVDDFESLNDSAGHAEGDRFLREVAYVIRERLGDDHLLFRFGGDEFALALPGMETAQAAELAREISRRVGRLRTPSTAAAPSLTVGVATLPTHTSDAHELVQLADGTLYWGKLNGKHRVAVYDPDVVKVMTANDRLKVLEQRAQLRATLALARALDARDAYTARHSENVARFAVAIAVELGWPPERLEMLRIAGLLHDVGKIGVQDATLRKSDKLSADEWHEMRRHPMLSARVIAGVAPEEILPWVIGHHERVDGRGYPRGLRDNQISLGARILAVADSFDAMTSSRSYRPGMPVQWAVTEIASCAGAQFDPAVVRAFLAAMANGTIGKDVAAPPSPDFIVEIGSLAAAPASGTLLDPEFHPLIEPSSSSRAGGSQSGVEDATDASAA